MLPSNWYNTCTMHLMVVVVSFKHYSRVVKGKSNFVELRRMSRSVESPMLDGCMQLLPIKFA